MVASGGGWRRRQVAVAEWHINKYILLDFCAYLLINNKLYGFRLPFFQLFASSFISPCNHKSKTICCFSFFFHLSFRHDSERSSHGRPCVNAVAIVLASSVDRLKVCAESKPSASANLVIHSIGIALCLSCTFQRYGSNVRSSVQWWRFWCLQNDNENYPKKTVFSLEYCSIISMKHSFLCAILNVSA